MVGTIFGPKMRLKLGSKMEQKWIISGPNLRLNWTTNWSEMLTKMSQNHNLFELENATNLALSQERCG